jgi:hypothetical protein
MKNPPKYLSLLISALTLVGCAVPTDTTTQDVATHHGIFIRGQSNAVGMGDCAQVSPSLCPAYSAVQMDQQVALQFGNPIDWVTYTGDLDNRAGGGMGIELELGRDLNTAVPDAWAIEKFAETNTGLQLHWLPTANYPTLPAGTPNLYAQSVTHALDAATSLDASIDVVVWTQGERDAKNATYAANYEANLNTLDAAWRADLGSDYLLVITELAATNSVYVYRDQVRAAEESFAATCTHCVLINTDGLPLKTDLTHYTSAALVTLADRVSTAVLADLYPCP